MSAIRSKRLIASTIFFATAFLLAACKDPETTETAAGTVASGNGVASSNEVASGSSVADGGNKSGSIMASVTLRWTPPGKRMDGSKLYPADIEGYRIRYRLKTEEQFRSVTVNNGSATEHTLTLEAGVYIFTIATIDSLNQESRPSHPVTASVI
ncbi:hypothetical protein C8D92_104214 [Tamilnaduibacter salinus]|uniref:Fibronectin type-III domain-containing protein n=2 Tax=Tamilnaduibacter salinus TaxID=1484056 RepID=A0A2U1CXI7_9GAMM|nr:fibronectin type III domain-containing protein [Tamilnaduibacter salinus]PVY76981.1 hypothetical protein C8D92_104214 [Tamilnaduibacter salinus]